MKRMIQGLTLPMAEHAQEREYGGGHWDFRFWLSFRSVFRFLCQKTLVFRFWCSLRFADFSFFSIRFSVFVENNSGFSVLLSNVVCIRFWPNFFAILRFLMIFSFGFAVSNIPQCPPQ